VRFLLDTNIISEIRKRERAHAGVTRWVAQTPVTEIGTSVIVLAEIRRGIELKRRTDSKQARSLDQWFAQMRSRLEDRVLSAACLAPKGRLISAEPVEREVRQIGQP
jgi:toxin FitB